MLEWAELEQIVRDRTQDLAPSKGRLAACAYGASVYGKRGSHLGYDVLLVCDAYANGLRAHRKMIDGNELRFLVADRKLIESDIHRGTLGDFLTEIFLYPYQILANGIYVENLGLNAKTRVVKEETRDLVIEYGEMCRGLVARPEFFGLSRLRKRARLFLPSMDQYLRLLEPEVREANISYVRDSFKKAIAATQGDVVEMDGDNVTVTDSIIDKWLATRSSEQVANILRQSRGAFYTYLSRGRAIYANLDLLVRELYSPLKFGLDQELAGMEAEDPKNHLYLQTSEGLASLNERASLEDIVSKLRPGYPITISPLAGVLNEVFLVTVGKERFVAKKFTDWHGFKWVTLNLVSFGSKFFAVSGKDRMSNEYGVNRYLSKKGMKVPEIVHVSLKEGILLESYVSGTSLVDFVTKVIAQRDLSKSQYVLSETLGETLGQIHHLGISIGDSKPENFVAGDIGLYVVDLEQAGRRKDYAWDLAELLFYSGHYSASPIPSRGLSELVQAFVLGYLRKGDAAYLRRAAGVRYARVFSLWTAAPIILEITKILRESH